MKALTIKQPWAHLIIHDGKDIENRDWPTRFRGRVAIHSSKKPDEVEFYAARHLLHKLGIKLTSGHFNISYGAIIGTVEIVECVSKSDSPWFMGDYGFVLRNPIALPEPILCKGALGFWDVPQELLSKITVAAAA